VGNANLISKPPKYAPLPVKTNSNQPTTTKIGSIKGGNAKSKHDNNSILSAPSNIITNTISIYPSSSSASSKKFDQILIPKLNLLSPQPNYLNMKYVNKLEYSTFNLTNTGGDSTRSSIRPHQQNNKNKIGKLAKNPVTERK
jgi:hypothetical protein